MRMLTKGEGGDLVTNSPATSSLTTSGSGDPIDNVIDKTSSQNVEPSESPVSEVSKIKEVEKAT